METIIFIVEWSANTKYYQVMETALNHRGRCLAEMIPHSAELDDGGLSSASDPHVGCTVDSGKTGRTIGWHESLDGGGRASLDGGSKGGL